MTSLTVQISIQATKPLVDFVHSADLSSGFIDRFNEFIEVLKSDAVQRCATQERPLPKLVPVQGFGSEIILSDQSLGFLFAPLRLFRPLITDDDLSKLTQSCEHGGSIDEHRSA